MLVLKQLLALSTWISAIAALPSTGTSSKKHSFDWDSTKYLIAFGDSYTYAQGTHGLQNYSFIGDQQDFSYDAQTLLTSKIVQNQTATAEGGPNWIEHLTGCGLNPGLTSPASCERQLWDFAFAGADISVEYTPLHHNFTVSLVNQITQYQTYGYPVLKTSLSPTNTLITIWIGINDISDSATYTTVSNFQTFYNELITTLFTSISSLHSLGYTSFLLLNLPPLDRTPGNQLTSSPSPNATQITWWNEILSSHVDTFTSSNSETSMFVFDAHSVLTDIMDHPAQYGIVNTTNFCAGYDQPDIDWNYKSYGCPTPLDTYFWFNSGHLTSHVHEILAGALLEQLKSWS